MADWLTVSKRTLNLAPDAVLRIVGTTLLSISLLASPSLAKDPFRTSNPRPIDDHTEAAFRALFEQGDYGKAATNLQKADPKDPLTPAMAAALVFMDLSAPDAQAKAARLEQFRTYADQTQQVAQNMLAKDPLRGNLYLAVGHFLEGAYIFTKDGTVKGTPQVLSEIQQAFGYLDTAEKADPNDPELNLIKGYMDLFVALNMPFSSPSKALDRLDKYASPRYLVDRGLALGYRDLNQQDNALQAIDRALSLTPNNPDLQYLKAQILVRQGKNQESLQWFDKALAKKAQLPNAITKQIVKERNRAEQRVKNVGR